MKIAVVTEDRINISQHFGRAPYYIVLTVENGVIENKEQRAKAGHHTFASQEHHETAPGQPHGCGPGSESKHATMAETISDCQVLLAGGMGWGAYQSIRSYGVEPIVTDVSNIDKAVELHLKGKLPNLMNRVH